MPKVWNKHHGYPFHPVYNKHTSSFVYIGRGSKWGNKYVIGRDGTRDEVCDKYERDALANPEFIEMIKTELKGKDLVCFCAPKRCHGDFLLRIANEE